MATFPIKSILLQKFYLETVLKVGKIVDIHFFVNVAFEKKMLVPTKFKSNDVYIIFQLSFLYLKCACLLKKVNFKNSASNLKYF